MTKDINGFNGFGVPFSDQKYDTTLAANVEQTLSVPDLVTGSYPKTFTGTPRFLAVFSYEPGASVWVANNATATVAGVAFATTDSELNPSARVVDSGDALHFITADVTAILGVVFYALFQEIK